VVRHEQELFVKCEHHQHRQTIKMWSLSIGEAYNWNNAKLVH
jgi:hypothetical protein